MNITKHHQQHRLLGTPSTKGLPFEMVKLTTSQRDDLVTNSLATNGMIIYNTTTNKFQGYANAVWVDLH